MTDIVELLPCPFCGDFDAEEAESAVPTVRGGKKRAVYCNGCFCEGCSMIVETGDLEGDVLRHLAEVSALYRKGRFNVRSRPIIGGVFGSCRFALCSLVYVERNLDTVIYLVMDTEAGFVLSRGYTKDEALNIGRLVLTTIPTVKLESAISAYKLQRIAKKAEEDRLRNEAFADRVKQNKDARSATIRSIPRRRRQIFEASEGKCHYCSTALTLDGKWHIEHKMPKALGGDNTPGNLVASCTPCNHEKRDTTDREYIAKRAAKGAA